MDYVTYAVTFALMTSVICFPDNFVSDRDCPLRCTCRDYSVDCVNTNVFPENLPAATRKLEIRESSILVFPANIFLDLKYLQEVSFRKMKIQTIRACAFAELEHMSVIQFSEVNINAMEGNAFSNIYNITRIVFQNSNIIELRSYSFHNLSSVSEVRFENTSIGVIHKYAMRKWDNVTDIGIIGCNISRFLREGFSNLSNIDLVYMKHTTVDEWQCGSISAVEQSGADFPISSSNFVCDCKLAWLWTKHSNSTSVFNRSNKCQVSDANIMSKTIDEICPPGKGKSLDAGCPPLLHSTPHTCSRKFDAAQISPVEKVEYPTYFSRKPESAGTTPSVCIPMIAFVYLVQSLIQ